MREHRATISVAIALMLVLVQITTLRFAESEALVRVVLPATIAAVPLALWTYRERLGVWIIFVGIAANLSVVVANGGLMPIRHETVVQALGEERAATYVHGQWIEGSKDVLVANDGGRLTELRDQILVSVGDSGMAASPGDFVVWAGLVVLAAEFSWSWHASRSRAGHDERIMHPAAEEGAAT